MAARNPRQNYRRPPSDVAAPTVEKTELTEPNAENRYRITRTDLPLSCPMPDMSLWNSHPRVYLPIESGGEAKCPYCGVVYVLE